jgi:hypothetical protein
LKMTIKMRRTKIEFNQMGARSCLKCDRQPVHSAIVSITVASSCWQQIHRTRKGGGTSAMTSQFYRLLMKRKLLSAGLSQVRLSMRDLEFADG